jgi:hypothetical protein
VFMPRADKLLAEKTYSRFQSFRFSRMKNPPKDAEPFLLPDVPLPQAYFP